MTYAEADVTAEQIYAELASIVANDMSDEDWHTATIHAVIHDDEDVTFQGMYTTPLSRLESGEPPTAHTNLASISAGTGSDHAGAKHIGSENADSDQTSTRLVTKLPEDQQASENQIVAEKICEEQVHYFRTQSEVFELILKLRKLLHEPGVEPFNEIDFTVNKDGNYKLFFNHSGLPQE